MRLLLALPLLLLAGCASQPTPHPTPSPLLHREYATLRYDAREVCIYNEWIDANPYDNSPANANKAWINDSLRWSNRYLREQERLEQAGHATPEESTMITFLCPDS
jgi:hypothetical protein